MKSIRGGGGKYFDGLIICYHFCRRLILVFMTLDPNLYGLLPVNLKILKAECAKIRMEILVLTYNAKFVHH